MKKKRIKKYLIITLLLMEVLTLSLTYKSYGNKILDNTKEEYDLEKETFSMYVETKDNEGNILYEEYNESEIFPTGYKINLEKSKCTDTKGNLINGILSGRENKVTITSNKTAYCYIYFDIDYALSQLCSSGDNLGSCITENNEEIDSLGDTPYSGMYRYTGTNEIVDDNYICFGTTDKEECINNPDTYMYRVIGVTSEANDTLGLDTNQVKLIKYIPNYAMEWYIDNTTDIKWEDSNIYQYINGNNYLTNNIYIPSGWSNKIDSIKWNIGNVQGALNGNKIVEMEISSQTTELSKIGLMYLSDYYYAHNAGGTVYCYSTACTNWLTDNSRYQWTMAYYGYRVDVLVYDSWAVRADGKTDVWDLTSEGAISPVFYLNSDEQYISGDGTLDNPIIISGPIMHTVNVSSNNTTYGTVTPITQEVVDTGNATITISPNTGYKYSSNTCGVEPVNNVITITNVTSDKECTVTFEPSQYSLTLTKGTGISTIYYKINGASSYTSATSTQTLNVNYGSTYYYYGVSSTGYTISSCTSSSPCSGTMGTSAVSKTLSATLNKYTVSVSSTNTSYGTVSPASQSINHGSNATITLSPASGYKYSSNTCGGTVSGNTMTISNITSGKTCTVTFTVNPAGTHIQSLKPTGLNTTMEGGLYRFQGTTANNYICFGTSTKSTCTSNTDAYMYRIIGINSSGQLKLIKKEALNTAYYWHNSASSNTTWPNSDLYKGLNGLTGGQYSNIFIGNSTYMPSSWSDKIADTSWKYGDNTNVNQTASALYTIENGWTNTTTAKIGLMYAHDYAYGMSGGNNCSSSGAYSTCKTSWLHLSNNDTETPSQYEWTMSRYGYFSIWGEYFAWPVSTDGSFFNGWLNDTYAVRPVFYLSTSVNYVSGTGTASDPFIIN